VSLVTQCPSCGTRFRVTAEQLEARQGKVRCGLCLAVFDGREPLVSAPDAAPPAATGQDAGAFRLEPVELGATAVAGVSLKLIKHGGITGVMRGAVLCDTLGLAINLAGKVAESSVAAAANLHCAAAMSDTAFGCSPANQGLAADVTADPLTVVNGTFALPTGPGLGVEVDEERVRSLLS